MKLFALGSLALIVSIGCGSKSTSDDSASIADRCAKGVGHTLTLTASQGGAGASADEQRAIEAVRKASVETCKSEGFTQAQLDCVLGAKTWDQFKRLGDCAALKTKRPGWLIIP